FMPLGAIKVTIQKFYRVNGGSTQYKGVIPDLILPDPYEYLETGERFLDYSLEWDEVKPLSYEKWNKSKLFLSQERTASRKRVEKNERFKKMEESIKLLKQRKDQTSLPLQLTEAMNEQKKIKDEMERYKNDEPLAKIQV